MLRDHRKPLPKFPLSRNKFATKMYRHVSNDASTTFVLIPISEGKKRIFL